MEFTADQIEQLTANLDGLRVKERAGFSYVEGWWAVHEANRIFGHGSWNHEVRDLTCVVRAVQGETNYTNREKRQGYLVAFTATIRVTVSDQFHDGVGYGEGIDYSNVGQANESAVKEAETDAMKRALKNWGNPFGLALYDKDQVDVERAPADKGHGYCTIDGHNNSPFYQSDKQRELGYPPSHKQGDGWCTKDESAAPASANNVEVGGECPEHHLTWALNSSGRFAHPIKEGNQLVDWCNKEEFEARGAVGDAEELDREADLVLGRKEPTQPTTSEELPWDPNETQKATH